MSMEPFLNLLAHCLVYLSRKQNSTGSLQDALHEFIAYKGIYD